MNRRLSVWVLDPANLTPYYSRALCEGIASTGTAVRFITSPFHYDPNVNAASEAFSIDFEYFRSLQKLQTQVGALVRKATRAALYLAGHRRVHRRACAERPDIVHFQWSRMPRWDFGLISRLKGRGIRVVHTVHDVEPLYGASGGRGALGRIYASCDAVIVHAQANARDLRERYPEIDAGRIHVVPHGPLQSESKPEGANRAAAREALGLPADAPIALFFGTIKSYKGLDVLMQAWPKVRERIPEALLLIAGKPGSPADVPELIAARRHGPDIRADFGFISNAEVWKYYLACDVAALPYRSITQSGVLLSTLAFGRPVVASHVGGLPEIIEAGRVGWVVPREDPAALASALIEALADRMALDAMGRRAAEFVQSEFAWPKIGRETVRIYNRLLAESRSAASDAAEE